MKIEAIPFEELAVGKQADGLIPAIMQDDRTLQVLMLGYMNREAFDLTLSSGHVTFYSRTRSCLWTKGETSGHFLDVVDMYADCDGDTLLIKAVPHGPTCHRGTVSCFDTPAEDGFIRSLSALIQRRHAEMPEDSYTTRLFIKGVKKIAQKVGEEAVESVVEAVDGNKDRFTYEACDLIYHLLVLVEQMGITLPDLEKELLKRHS